MKKLLFGLLFSNVFIHATAQVVVNDPLANKQMIFLNEQIMLLNQNIAALSATNMDSKIANQAIDKTTGKDFDLAKFAEDALWKVEDYLKRGTEINTILEQEKSILQKLQSLDNSSNQVNFQFKRQIMNVINNALKNTGGLVDTALKLLTDKVYRMDTEKRRAYLQEISSKLMGVESYVNSQMITLNSMIQQKKKDEEIQKAKEDAIRKANTLKIIK